MAHPVPPRLKNLYARIDACARCRAAENPLRHVMGGGRYTRPKFFFLFINPTHKNLSSQASYLGERSYPFIGVRHLYRGLAEGGFLDDKLVTEIYARGWQTADEHRIEASLRAHSIYISNFVKCAQPNPINPTKRVMRENLPLLGEELALVNPEYVVTFGLLPLEVLTGASYQLRDILSTVDAGTYAPLTSLSLSGKTYPVLPCYYPLGHGNPPRAHKILLHIKQNF